MDAVEALTKYEFPAKLICITGELSSKYVFGMSVHQHGLLTGYVLQELLALIRTRHQEALVPTSLTVLAALHDVGKINPEFLRKLLRQIVTDDKLAHWQALIKAWAEMKEVPHAAVSRAVLEDLGAPTYCAEVVAEHHGYPTGLVYENRSEVLGGISWAQARKLVGERLLHQFSAEALFPRCIRDRAVKPIQVELWKGLVVLADWIASRQGEALVAGTEKVVAQRLVSEAGFQSLSLNKAKSFQAIFACAPRVEQSLLVEAYTGPGVYVLEAPTGSGKTEAALGLAFKALQNEDAKGFYFALPTQLTSDLVHKRVETAIESFLDKHHDIRLTYGTGLLQIIRLGKEGAPGELWNTSSRLALLAPFGVGTVDQALLALLNSKFHQVRLAGLLGKVVILDEVHSYDSYTTELISRLLRMLEAMGAVVVILSATLTHSTLRRLLGLDSDVKPSTTTTTLTVKTASGIYRKGLTTSESRLVNVKLLENQGATGQALAEAIKCATEGMQVIWIENSVPEAQRIFQKIQALGITSGLIHSRFRSIDRQTNEGYWTKCFGKSGGDERQNKGRILVGTQVLEQSLDLDADFMVSRIAPMDLLIQRLGRLWRHKGTYRPQSCKKPTALILTTPEKDGNFVTVSGLRHPFGVTGQIYHPYTLFRTQEVLKGRLVSSSTLTLPQDVRSLLDDALELREERDVVLARFKEEMASIEREQLAKALGMLSVSSQIESSAGTRLINQDTFETLILMDEDQPVFMACRSKEDVVLAIEERLVRSPKKIVSVGVDALAKWLHPTLFNWLKSSPRYVPLDVCFCQQDGNLTREECKPIGNEAFYGKVLGLCVEK